MLEMQQQQHHQHNPQVSISPIHYDNTNNSTTTASVSLFCPIDDDNNERNIFSEQQKQKINKGTTKVILMKI